MTAAENAGPPVSSGPRESAERGDSSPKDAVLGLGAERRGGGSWVIAMQVPPGQATLCSLLALGRVVQASIRVRDGLVLDPGNSKTSSQKNLLSLKTHLSQLLSSGSGLVQSWSSTCFPRAVGLL